jgi:hypothetical protein
MLLFHAERKIFGFSWKRPTQVMMGLSFFIIGYDLYQMGRFNEMHRYQRHFKKLEIIDNLILRVTV